MYDADKVKTIVEAMGDGYFHLYENRDKCWRLGTSDSRGNNMQNELRFTDWRFVGRCMEWLEKERGGAYVEVELFYGGDISILWENDDDLFIDQNNGTLPERILAATYEVAKRKLEVSE